MQFALDLGSTPVLPIARPSALDGTPNLPSYDKIIVMFSAGKDSIAATLHLIELGYHPELWHHEVDGRAENFFDWPCTEDYTRKVADHLELDLYFSWREGGLEQELTKENNRTSAVVYEMPNGETGRSGGERGKIATRKRWPALSADLRTRWCSGVAKIDVGSAAISGQERFKGKKILVITGERAEESAARAKYEPFELHRSHAPGPRSRRTVHHWRPVLDWSEKQVWEIIEKHGIVPHPCYRLGFARASCMICIFSSARQAATVRQLDEQRFAKVCGYEKDFGHTIRNGISFEEHANNAPSFQVKPDIVKLAMSRTYDSPIWTDKWELPSGAYGEKGGPS